VADLANRFRPGSLLDVGGEGILTLFMKRVEITTANIKEADICYPGGKLPLEDESFDVVVSLDTIEHHPKDRRMAFLEDLYRVSRRGIIVCGPIGTPEHCVHEKEVFDSGVLSGVSRDYLGQHLEFGLPGSGEVSEMLRLLGGHVYYQGDFREIGASTEASLLSYLSLSVQTLKNISLDLLWDTAKHVSEDCGPYTNRFYLVSEKDVNGI